MTVIFFTAKILYLDGMKYYEIIDLANLNVIFIEIQIFIKANFECKTNLTFQTSLMFFLFLLYKQTNSK